MTDFDEAEWGDISGFRPAEMVPELERIASRGERSALGAVEELLAIATYQGSVSEAALPMISVLERVAAEGERPSARRSAHNALGELAQGVSDLDAALPERPAAESHVALAVAAAAASAVARLEPLPAVASAEEVLDLAWREAWYAGAVEIVSFDVGDGELPQACHCVRPERDGWVVYFSTGHERIGEAWFGDVSVAAEELELRRSLDPHPVSAGAMGTVQTATFALWALRGLIDDPESDVEAVGACCGPFFVEDAGPLLLEWLGAVNEDDSVGATLTVFALRALSFIRAHGGPLPARPLANRRAAIEQQLRNRGA